MERKKLKTVNNNEPIGALEYLIYNKLHVSQNELNLSTFLILSTQQLSETMFIHFLILFPFIIITINKSLAS